MSLSQKKPSETLERATIKKLATPTITASGSMSPQKGGLTTADQFNILLFHTSFAEKEWNSMVDSDAEVTKTVHITSPSITIEDVLIDFPCRFEVGQIYTVNTEELTFFTTEGAIRLWPEEWYAKDIICKKNDLLLFLGVARYDIVNSVTSKRNAIFVLNFLWNELVIQYPVFHHLKNFSSVAEFADYQKENFESAMSTVLLDTVSSLAER